MTSPPRGAAFGVGRSRTIIDEQLAPIRTRLARAARHARELSDAVTAWREKATLTSTVEIDPASPTVLTVMVESSRPFPHDAWAAQAGDLAHQARGALDNLHDLLARTFAESSYNPARIQFPVTSTEENWEKWAKNHQFHPGWLIERLHAVQPFAGPYKALEGLHWFNNKDKHEWVRDLELAMSGLVAESNATLRGLIEEHSLSPTVIAHSNVIPRGVRRVKVGAFDLGYPIHDFPTEARNDLKLSLQFVVGSASYSLEEFQEIPVRIGYIVDYLACDDLSAVALYQRRPHYFANEAEAV